MKELKISAFKGEKPLDNPENVAREIDRLGLYSCEILSSLFPGSEISIDYKKPTPANILGLSGVVEIQNHFDDKKTFSGSFHELPHKKGWYRRIQISVSEEILKTFFPEILSGNKKMGSDIKKEIISDLNSARSIAEGVSSAWHLSIVEDPWETIFALENELPRWICSHILANYFYSISKSEMPKNRHDMTAETFAKILKFFDDLSSSRVEHGELSHGVVVSKVKNEKARGRRISDNLRYPDDLKLKRISLLSNGSDSLIHVSTSGQPISLIFSEKLSRRARKKQANSNASTNYNFVSTASCHYNGIGLHLRSDGVQTIYYQGRPILIKRGGKWRGLLWKSLMNGISRRFGETGMLLFNTAVILSENRQGGILGILDSCPNGVHEKDRVDLALKSEITPHKEWTFHRLLFSEKPQKQFSPEAISMLAGIDGATIFDLEGNLVAYGAVVNCQPSGSEGARSAAAKKLSQDGFVLKVSSDGPITVFYKGQEVVEV